MIAMALALNPMLIVADEPTTALDATVQAQVLDVLQRLQREYETALIMITHDLGVIADIADSVMVMYAGKAAEYADRRTLFYQPHHPYTIGLLESIPGSAGAAERLRPIRASRRASSTCRRAVPSTRAAGTSWISASARRRRWSRWKAGSAATGRHAGCRGPHSAWAPTPKSCALRRWWSAVPPPRAGRRGVGGHHRGKGERGMTDEPPRPRPATCRSGSSAWWIPPDQGRRARQARGRERQGSRRGGPGTTARRDPRPARRDRIWQVDAGRPYRRATW